MIEIAQGTPEWHQWRLDGIGASEMAAVMGLSPHATPYDIWLLKTVRSEGTPINFAMQRGSDLESRARAMFELLYMLDMKPCLAVHPVHPHFRCSLDGRSDDGKQILEIKVPSRETHEAAKRGEVPEHYRIQIQHQLMATGAELCYFFTYSPTDDTTAMVEVLPDLEMQAKIFIIGTQFWVYHVQMDIPPPLMPQDVKDVDESEFMPMFLGIKKDDDTMKKAIIDLGGHNKIRCGKYLLSKSQTKSGKDSYRLTMRKDG